MLCVSARLVALLGRRRPEQREQQPWPARVRLRGRVRQLRRKQPAGGGSVPEATGAATDDEAAVMPARLAAHAAVAANVAFARPGLLLQFRLSLQLQSASVVREGKNHRNVRQLTCERAGAPRVTCSKRPEATQWTCFVVFCDAPDDDRGTDVWARNRGSEQLARTECDWAA